MDITAIRMSTLISLMALERTYFMVSSAYMTWSEPTRAVVMKSCSKRFFPCCVKLKSHVKFTTINFLTSTASWSIVSDWNDSLASIQHCTRLSWSRHFWAFVICSESIRLSWSTWYLWTRMRLGVWSNKIASLKTRCSSIRKAVSCKHWTRPSHLVVNSARSWLPWYWFDGVGQLFECIQLDLRYHYISPFRGFQCDTSSVVVFSFSKIWSLVINGTYSRQPSTHGKLKGKSMQCALTFSSNFICILS